MDKRYGHARFVSLLALLFERHGELTVRVRAGRGLGADAPVEHGNLCAAAKFRMWRDFLTLIKNEGRDDVVVLLDRAVGARREGREGRHHDLRHRSRQWGLNYLTWRRSRPHTSARSIGACLWWANHFSATSAMLYAPARAAERVELVHHEELRLFTFEHLAAAYRRSKFHLGRVVAEK